jgi:regulator of nucleoside diphosphate kinase
MSFSANLSRPEIVLRTTDAERLTTLALQLETQSPEVSNLLHDEIGRATVRDDDSVPGDVVGMNSVVVFRDEAHGATRTVRLVYPADADIAAGSISVFTPIGAGLLGLTAGQSILWPDRMGNLRSLRVLEVSRPGFGENSRPSGMTLPEQVSR